MKIIQNLESKNVTFIPSGTFQQKINTLLKTINYKLVFDGEFYIKKTRSKKKTTTYLPSWIKKKPKDVLIIYQFGTKENYTYINKKGFKKKREGFKYASYFYNFIDENLFTLSNFGKITKESLIITACEILIQNYYAYQVSFSQESEAWPLHSVSFKFIYPNENTE